MNNENGIIKLNTGLMQAMQNGAINIDVFSKDITVLDCLVAGTSFYNVKSIETELNENDKLDLQREPSNEYDEFAIAIYYKEQKIGFIPKIKNESVARLLDAGKKFHAVIKTKNWEGNWLKLSIEVVLND
ncbi:MAG: hypothetical protein RJA25_334 [Bacteroidota bacterium]|jgi:hypothetical protein